MSLSEYLTYICFLIKQYADTEKLIKFSLVSVIVKNVWRALNVLEEIPLFETNSKITMVWIKYKIMLVLRKKIGQKVKNVNTVSTMINKMLLPLNTFCNRISIKTIVL